MDQYSVFGNPIEHSKSPQIHGLFAKQTGESLEYTKQKVPQSEFQQAAQHFFKKGGKGLNITVPFKLDAYEYADQLTERATNAGAVNTLKLLDDGTVLGDNTDGFGMVSDITTNLGWQLADKRVLILGAGGAVRGVLQPVLDQKPQCLVVANRTASKAEDLAHAFARYGAIEACGFDELNNRQFDVVINGTSASLGGDLPPLPDRLLADNAACYDMMYGAEPTVFLRWAEQQGCTLRADGLGMLVGQAAESFYLWRGVRPETAPVIKTLREAL